MLIPTTQTVKTITDLRENALGLLADIEKSGLVYIFHHSKPKAVMLSMENFITLNELIEDYLDELEAKKLASEKKGKGIPLTEIIRKYQ